MTWANQYKGMFFRPPQGFVGVGPQKQDGFALVEGVEIWVLPLYVPWYEKPFLSGPMANPIFLLSFVWSFTLVPARPLRAV